MQNRYVKYFRPPDTVMRTGLGTGVRRLVIGLVVALSASCADPSLSSTGAQENTRAEIAALPSWTLAAVPTAKIGVLDGDPVEVFGSIRAGALGPHGIYVLDGSFDEVRVFDEAGGHVMSLGREGDGPGEFRNPTELMVGLDSTITVWDRSLRRLTVFGHGGDVIRTASVQQNFLNPGLATVADDGSFVISDFRYPQSGLSERGVGEIVLTAYSGDGEFLDTLAALTGPYVSGVDGLGIPFASPDLVGSARDGVWVLRVDSTLAVRLSIDGDTLGTVSWESPARDVTDADLDARGEFESGVIRDPDARAARMRRLRQPGFAVDRHPTATRIKTDGVGRVWIVERENLENISSPTWLVFGASGRVAGRWEEPLENLSLLDAADDRALVLVSDDLGVQSVELRQINRD